MPIKQPSPYIHMLRVLKGSMAGRSFETSPDIPANPELYEGPFPLYREANNSAELGQLKCLLRDLYLIRPGQPGCGDFSREQRTYADLAKFIEEDAESRSRLR